MRRGDGEEKESAAVRVARSWAILIVAGWLATGSPAVAGARGAGGVGDGAGDGARQGAGAGPGVRASGRILVRPRKGMEEKAEGAITELLVGRDDGLGLWVVRAPAAAQEGALTAALKGSGLFSMVTPDWWCAPAQSAEPPNDPLLGAQWHTDRMRARHAWTMATGCPAPVVAVVDSGIESLHPDLQATLLPGFALVGGDAEDENGHGTAIAGLAGAVGNNGVGGVGVGWSIRLRPVRIAGPDGMALLSDIVAGVRAAADAGDRVICVAYSGVRSPAAEVAGAYAEARGSLLVWAGGNSADPAEQVIGAESDWASVVVVGASNEEDGLAEFSARGPGVDLVAPGVATPTTVLGGGQGTVSGTSGAAGLVAGAAALVWCAAPNLTAAEVRGILLATATDLGAPGEDGTFGRGRVDVFRAVATAVGGSAMSAPVALPDAGAVELGGAAVVDVLGNDAAPAGSVLRIAAFDGVSMLGGSVARLVGAGPGGRDVLRYQPPAREGLVGGPPWMDEFAYQVADGGGGAAAWGVVRVTVDDPGLYRPAVTPLLVGPGVRARGYALAAGSALPPDFAGLAPVEEGLVAGIGFATTGGEGGEGPLAGGATAWTAVVYEGLVDAPARGVYTFALEAAAGGRVVIGGRDVVGPGSAVLGDGSRRGEVGLRAGFHRIRVEQWRGVGPAGLRVRWGPAGLVGGPLEEISVLALASERSAADVVSIGGFPPADGALTVDDYTAFLNAFAADEGLADIVSVGGFPPPDGEITVDDYTSFVNAFAEGG